MIKALWFLIKFICLIAAFVFLYIQEGTMNMTWRDYTITMPFGVAAVGIFATIFVIASVVEIITRLSYWPERYARARAEKRRAKGYRALLQSLSSAAMGDQKNALALAERAQKYLPVHEEGLPLLLQAQAKARQKGVSSVAYHDAPYQALLKNADTALLGLQGMTQNAILAGDFAKALVLAQKALADNPKNYSLLKAVYDLEIRNRLWNDALITLEQAVKRKVITRHDADHDRMAIYCCLGDMAEAAGRSDEAMTFYKRAYALDEEFIPAITRYARSLLKEGSRRKALKILTTAWKNKPHRDIVDAWMSALPDNDKGKTGCHVRHAQELTRHHPDDALSHLTLARYAIDDGLWGEAKESLARAEKSQQSAEVYALWVTLEEKTTHRADVIRQWLDRMYSAPTYGVWLCSKTGKSFDTWHAVVDPEGFFNTLYWSDQAVQKASSAHNILSVTAAATRSS